MPEPFVPLSCFLSFFIFLFLVFIFLGSISTDTCAVILRGPIRRRLLVRLVGLVESLGSRKELVEQGMEHCEVRR